MRIDSRKKLENWDLNWPTHEKGPWRLNRDEIKSALLLTPRSIGVYWIGTSPQENHGTFNARYCGKAVKQPLLDRLTQHATGRGNPQVAIHLRDKYLSKSEPLWFRFVVLPTIELAEFTEGTMISAFREEYKWNKRNEFKQQWMLELS